MGQLVSQSTTTHNDPFQPMGVALLHFHPITLRFSGFTPFLANWLELSGDPRQILNGKKFDGRNGLHEWPTHHQ